MEENKEHSHWTLPWHLDYIEEKAWEFLYKTEKNSKN